MKGSLRQARKFSIRVTVGSMFLIATMMTALVAISLQYHFGKAMSQEQVMSKLTLASGDVSDYVKDIELSASNSARILKSVAMATERKFTRQEIQSLITEVLTDNPMFYSIYYGKKNEDFFQVINLNSSPTIREKMLASEQEHWVVIDIRGVGEKRFRTTRYYDSEQNVTRITREPSRYFPTQRPWYGSALEDRVIKTEPYLFQHLKITGQTYSIRSAHSVIGIDIVLSSVASHMTPQAMGLSESYGMAAYLFNQKGEIIAQNSEESIREASMPEVKPVALSDEQKQWIEDLGVLKVSNQLNWMPYDFSRAGEPKGYAVDLMKLIASMTGLKFEFTNGFSSEELTQRYQNGQVDILNSVMRAPYIPGIASQPLFYIQPALATLKHLNVDGKNVQHQKVATVLGQAFADVDLNGAHRVEFKDLSSALSALQKGDVDAVLNSEQALMKLQETSIGREIEIERLIAAEPLPIFLYVDEKQLELSALLNQALSLISDEQRTWLSDKWFRHYRDSNFVPYRELLELAQQPLMHGTMQFINVNGEDRYIYVVPINSSQEYLAVVVPEALVMEQVTQQLWRSLALTIAIMLLLLPTSWIFGSPIVQPITALIDQMRKIKRRRFDEVCLVDTHIKEVHQLSQAMMDMVAEIQKHEKAQDEFIEAFIELIAGAIDDKSPYTAGHCNRVPELGLMLAKVAEECQEGKFKAFKFKNNAERREFRIAAWLHDCGKITTPEHVVDKGSKLEANYNRIHEIRTRFEVLWRDAEIEYLKRLIARNVSKAQADAQLAQRREKLQEEFAFIARCNVGGEFMQQEAIERIEQIAAQTWLRHFDDRLGLSPLEESRLTTPAAPLPAVEPLLVDKVEHIIERDRPMQFDAKYGINIDVPEHLYNLGEIYNLSIRAGTLTREDRFKINEHMISGIKMLESLPFPEELARVPRYASTHHETLKGTGYPRKLSAEQLSIPERILVIADVFEALTAADRPYKKAKPLSVAVDIMYKMALDEHLDMDLFLLFLKSGTYLEYAQMFLPEKQIDSVDINQYINATLAA
ncbi:HD domain-containing phosphohydrolase [Vibrio vulnificus]|uniref:HD domain-containing phosphohydrolase n=1 Tax=Vibrio vulnificus TaxID=672 RepID=UPI00092794CD|nr:HD domain-containing phosphohydrolase [Vibrio vulnificus]MCU8201949.1 transporter substrate-binding domain-containing protein [Vibrio vulnificus]OJI36965.1 Cyclic di-GMP phosphodiesterase response regulator RpfG [Vibrio vulnificus]HAS8179111.1 transporter substrate-binding domain-containing protein [Vibrio vulnificus]